MAGRSQLCSSAVSAWKTVPLAAAQAYPLQSSSRNTSGSSLANIRRGRGGRSSYNGITATVFGASGFLGRYVVNQLGKIGSQIIVPFRGTQYDVDHLKVCGDLGQIHFSPFYLRDEESIRDAMKHSNVVINLLGRDWETKNFTYSDVNVKGAALIARLAAECGVERLIHVSALGASTQPEVTFGSRGSRILSTKGQGEEAVRRLFPDVTIMRPSDMWGDEDRFFRYWATYWRRHLNALPLWKRGEITIKQPVDVRDVAQGIIRAAQDNDTKGVTFECIGARGYYLGDMLEYFFDEMRLGRVTLLPIQFPTFIAKVKLCELIYPATPPLVMDRLLKESVSDISTGCPTLEDLGVKPGLLEDAARYQLRRFRIARHYAESLNEIGYAPPPLTADEVEATRRQTF